LCDIGDICVLDPENDADGDGVCESDEIYGCTDSEAATYNEEATEDDGSCIYTNTYDLDYHEGPNLVSYYVFPTLDNFLLVQELSELFEGNNLYSILSQSNAALLIGGGWVGSLTQMSKTDGYWIKLEDAETISYTAFPNFDELVYSLDSGPNLISFPSDGSYPIEDVLPASLDGVVYAILSENEAAYYENGQWFGMLTDLQGFNGYWFKSSGILKENSPSSDDLNQ
jgi:hypothetical protein